MAELLFYRYLNKKGIQKTKGDVIKHRPFMLNSLNKSRL